MGATDGPGAMAAADLAALLAAMRAAADGDFSVRVRPAPDGLAREVGLAFNRLVESNAGLAGEIARVRRTVGRDGLIAERAAPPLDGGAWRASVDALNALIDDLVRPTEEFARVIGAVAGGDLTQRMAARIEGHPVRGEFQRIRATVNAMVDRLSSFADEVTRVAREVGTEGKLGGQAKVKGLAGTWRDLTDSVNSMAANLTDQVRNIAEVTTAVAQGDLSRKITVDVHGEVLQLKDTINTMVDQLRSFADEVTRVAREVGTEGRLGGQADVRGVSGTWRDLTDNVNTLAGNLTSQVRGIAQVTTAVARGDLSRKITVDARGEVAELKETINTMVDQLRSFAGEVTRVAREVGTEGRLGGQANVEGVSGTWRDLTDSVNLMAANLTDQVRNIAEVTTAVARGDLSQKITVDVKGEVLQLKDTINTMVDQLSSFADEVTRVAREVGTEGRLGGQANVRGVSGTWRDLTDSVNFMASSLTTQVRNIAEVTTAVARGDLSQKITVDVKGEVLELKATVNTMVDQLRSFAGEVTRVAREVGTEGRLGGQANVEGVSGTWRDLTDSVNLMASSLTDQVRNIADVATAVARGDLSQKITVPARGEILELATTLNTMVDQLRSFADEVTRVAREVGTEGKLGGQARVEDVSGTWRALTDSVNSMAANLTDQVRAIAAVSTAVTQGDLTRSIGVEAQGEVAELKDTINQMIVNLRETTERNAEGAWLNANLARFGGMMQGQRDLGVVTELIVSELTPLVGAHVGAFFLMEREGGEQVLRLAATYGYRPGDEAARAVLLGDGMVGQAALDRSPIVIESPPEGYITVASGLGSAAPTAVVVQPVLFEDRVMGVIELAGFEPFTDVRRLFLEQLAETIGIVINAIVAGRRTEELLQQSQTLTHELQSRQRELQQTNAELAEKAALLADQNERIEVKNREIEMARLALEEKAEQLALSSRYKSEFLANMSHELRTPLNSLLILARLLADNGEGNLSPGQVEFAQTIFASGNELLALIDDILDLSKVEAGRMGIDRGAVALRGVADAVERSFRPLVEEKGLRFEVVVEDGVPATIVTDGQRLQQILRNLLANAVKFTETGGVALRVGRAPAHAAPIGAGAAVAFAVTDTGIGIPADRQEVIFEAFRQADGTTSRRFGGTGLGLSISREIAHLLGGRLTVESTVGVGSRFTLVLPDEAPGEGEPDADAAGGDGRAPAGEGPARAGARAVAAARPAHAPVPTPPGGAGGFLHGRRVLIVDDDVRNVFALASALEARGAVVSHAGSGTEGLDVLGGRDDVDVVLLDVMLPGMDGHQVTRRIRSLPGLAGLPVVIVTARADAADRAEAMAAGATGYLTKPVDTDRLLGVLRDVLDGDAGGAE
ncbi:HAMP domain-containing protein [Miltoncostaea marina]|uniref:HAMP domain-containing protein n=1 Tax=Miltoncostaea marina TaxID=2843215 RepID=UPI001C3D8F06|nr:HAMP domain-containing protein [Miltoncostaea marina]